MEAFEICAGCRGLAISRDFDIERISLGGGVHFESHSFIFRLYTNLSSHFHYPMDKLREVKKKLLTSTAN